MNTRLPIAFSATAVVIALLGATPLGRTAAQRVVGINADKVDGKDAVGFGSSINFRKGKLVATSKTTGLLPSNIIDGYQPRCQTGAVLGFARIKGAASFPSTYTSNATFVDTAFNCTGGEVQARRLRPGVYLVRFVGSGAVLAFGNVISTAGFEQDQKVLLWKRAVDPLVNQEVFEVFITDTFTNENDDATFALMLP